MFMSTRVFASGTLSHVIESQIQTWRDDEKLDISFVSVDDQEVFWCNVAAVWFPFSLRKLSFS